MPSAARFATPPAGSNFGALAARTSRSPAAWRSSSAGGKEETAPSKLSVLCPPSGAALLPVPFTDTTRTPPSAATATETGNQADGSAPTKRQTWPALYSTMPNALMPAQATYSRLPPGANATDTGWLPNVPAGKDGIFTSTAAMRAVSKMDSESECALATTSVAPSSEIAMEEGARPVAISRTDAGSRGSMTDKVPLAEDPVEGSVSTWVRALNAVVSPGWGRRPPRLAT